MNVSRIYPRGESGPWTRKVCSSCEEMRLMPAAGVVCGPCKGYGPPSRPRGGRLLLRNLNELRVRSGVSSVMFAEQIGISPKTIIDYERGHFLASPEMAAAIAEVLGVGAGDLTNAPEANG